MGALKNRLIEIKRLTFYNALLSSGLNYAISDQQCVQPQLTELALFAYFI